MSQPTDSLPADVLTTLRDGDKLGAIKLLRAARGVGLKEAKDAVEQYLRGEPVSFAQPRPERALAPEAALPSEVVEAMQRGRKIDAIQLLRERTGLGLAQAKAAVEGLPRAARAGGEESPAGERSSSGGLLLAVGLAVVGTVLFYVLS